MDAFCVPTISVAKIHQALNPRSQKNPKPNSPPSQIIQPNPETKAHQQPDELHVEPWKILDYQRLCKHYKLHNLKTLKPKTPLGTDIPKQPQSMLRHLGRCMEAVHHRRQLLKGLCLGPGGLLLPRVVKGCSRILHFFLEGVYSKATPARFRVGAFVAWG